MAKQVKIDIVARDKTKQAIASSKKGLGSLKTFALAASAALASIGAGRALNSLVNLGKEMESLQIRFKLLFGSAEEGAKAFDTLSSFASKVPFSLGDIASASGNLAVVAKDAKELNKILEITGNVAGATGLDFQTTASQIQRAFAGGIASADIFREKGVRDMLGFSAGAKISVEETREAFARVFAGDGEFANTTKELANTLEGTLSMIGDKFLAFKLAINEAFFAELKKQFGDLDTFLAENEESILKFGKNIGEGLAFSLKETVESVELIVAGFALMSRATDLLDNKTGGYLSTLLELSTAQGRMNLLMELFTGNQQDLTEVFNSLLQPAIATSIRQSGEYLESLNSIVDATNNVSEATNNTVSSIEALTFAQQNVKQGFLDQKQASKDAHETETKQLKTKKESEQALFKSMKTLADEGSKRSKKMFRVKQALAIGEAIMSTYAGAASALKDYPAPFSFGIAALTVATGLAQVANIRAQQPPAQFGGARQAGSPFLVGERGPELFTPATAGTVTPNHQLGGGSATVNFNITTVDAQSFGALLDTRRGQIVNMINTALNNKGQAALV